MREPEIEIRALLQQVRDFQREIAKLQNTNMSITERLGAIERLVFSHDIDLAAMRDMQPSLTPT